jgi:hypothetical protein
VPASDVTMAVVLTIAARLQITTAALLILEKN